MNSEQAFSEDTPQAEGSTTGKPFSFDDVIYGPEGKPNEAPPRTPEQVTKDIEAQETKPVEMAQIPTEQPAPTPTLPPEVLPQVEGQTQPDGSTYQAKNDEKRFEYWQSQAAKLQNQVNEMQQKMPLIEHLERNPQMAQPQQAQAPVEQPTEEFPPPPEKPARPRSFSREAAYTDPASESAAYLDEVEDWRDNMDEYNELKQEYESARVQEYMQQQEAMRHEQMQRQQAAAQQRQQVDEVNHYVQGHYGMSAQDAQEFIQEFSDPNSVSMDNLVELYRIKKGQGAPAVNTHDNPVPATPTPSPTFQQTQRAQQVAPTMGVVSGQGSAPQAEAPAGQKLMEALIGTHNDNKAF